MLNNVASVSGEDFLTRFLHLASTHDAAFYLDTSFLLWAARLGRPARAEFLSWVNAVGADRFHVPVWSAHEFFRHKNDDTWKKDFKDDLGGFDKAVTRLYASVRASVSDELLGGPNRSQYFLSELTSSVQRLRTMTSVASKHADDELIYGLGEVSTFIDLRRLTSPMDKILETIEADERVRNRGRIPPGFNDAHKRGGKRFADLEQDQPLSGDNSFGDLVFWMEVLEHARRTNLRTIVLILNDRKTDWLFKSGASADSALLKESSRLGPVPIAHPWLTFEAKSRANVAELVLIDCTYLALALKREIPPLRAFPSAVLQGTLPQVNVRKEGDLSFQWWSDKFNPVASPSAAQPLSSAPSRAQLLSDLQMVSGSGLREDPSATLAALAATDEVALTALIDELAWPTLGIWTARELVVFGRHLFTRAESGSDAARAHIHDFVARGANIEAGVANPVYCGLLASLYVDQDLARRISPGNDLTAEILSIVTQPWLENAARAVGDFVKTFDEKPLFSPSDKMTTFKLTTTLNAAADGASPQELTSILYGSTELSTSDYEDSPTLRSQLGNRASAKLGEIIDLIAKIVMLPRHLIEVEPRFGDTVQVGETMRIRLGLNQGQI
ncbi:hypothetical protein GALL_430630 [mine drainage metagenome]|uniref:PIN like domain-containing protein n=1 Tax=mine drainage metagenome TaxID=410659 RepID=A0A1J5QH09_9ZZZZ